MNANKLLPRVALAKSILPPSVATCKTLSNSFNRSSGANDLSEGSSAKKASATAFWISKIAL